MTSHLFLTSIHLWPLLKAKTPPPSSLGKGSSETAVILFVAGIPKPDDSNVAQYDKSKHMYGNWSAGASGNRDLRSEVEVTLTSQARAATARNACGEMRYMAGAFRD
eukprot:CAMPEP_0175086832 /NCGR_PEP_ID=MMETSP0052_2-20121109/29480_1 /TAXON_ID=51329 ORGANISM="Polytomella parva, Strain SAG 63-3" /NCGR_SAMPLE_ID=MMETSP0052_2 /ASSEMBLY_ACC=CAM_ASM_000194 /LENGTH=106 /DNA_ID=CAMNT_0016359083 /DNA_START=47 /DNA_END=366 /DNA_ORIENTATION=-